MTDNMITQNMNDAGFKAYVATSKNDADKYLAAIYKAMSNAKQTEALDEYWKNNE